MWTPFDSIYDGLSSFGSWLGNGFSSFGNGIWNNILSPAMDFIDPSGALHTTERQELADQTNRWNLANSVLTSKHQVEYDKWAQNFSEQNAQWQKDFANKQFNEQSELARSPISTLLADASKSGVSPMAALGQNVGSVSVGSSTPSAGNSSLGNNQAAIHLSQMNTLPSLMQTLSNSVLGKRQQELTKDMFDKELDYKYDALHTQERMASARNKVQLAAQQIISNFNAHKEKIDLANLEISRGLSEQQISKMQSEINNLRGAYEKSMAEIEHMKNVDSNQKAALRAERERTYVNAISGIISSVVGAAGNLIGKGFLPF